MAKSPTSGSHVTSDMTPVHPPSTPAGATAHTDPRGPNVTALTPAPGSGPPLPGHPVTVANLAPSDDRLRSQSARPNVARDGSPLGD